MAFAYERDRARQRLVFGGGVGDGAFDLAGVEREGEVGKEPVAQLRVQRRANDGKCSGLALVGLVLDELRDDFPACGEAAARQ